jgi:hypothetical protein
MTAHGMPISRDAEHQLSSHARRALLARRPFQPLQGTTVLVTVPRPTLTERPARV